MNQRDTIAAIFDPGHFVGTRPAGETLTQWQARAVEQALTAAGYRIVGPAEMEKAEAKGKWRAVQSAISRREWGVESDDPALIDEGEEMVVPCRMREEDARLIADLHNAALASPHMPVPAGWVLVPEEPTDEMTEAASDASEGFHEIDGDKGPWLRSEGYAAAYRAMLSAAPKPAALTQEPKP